MNGNETVVVAQVGDLKVAKAGTTLAAIGLGSCVAVALYDPDARVGALGHVMLPEPVHGRTNAPVGRFASTAVPELLGQMETLGAERRRVHARLVGGAAMFSDVLPPSGRKLGQRNVSALRTALKRAGIPVRAEEVGGEYGRSLYFRLDDGRILVTSVQQPDVLL